MIRPASFHGLDDVAVTSGGARSVVGKGRG